MNYKSSMCDLTWTMGMLYTNPTKICEFSQNTLLSNLMEKIESVQYSAALAVTGAWRRTSRQKPYAALGWESLSSRRWSRRLTLDVLPCCTRL